MKKIHLDQIEVTIDPPLVAGGGDLIANGKVESGVESEKNLWLFKVENYEVEVQTYGRRVQSFTCECSDFFKEGICTHSVAAFFEIRKKKNAPKKNRKPKKAVATSPKRMTVSVILKEVKNEELVRFIAEYARKDQQFTNALKTRFATQVEAVDLKDKYGQLMHTIVRSNRSANQSFTRSGARKIYDMLCMLLEQVEDEFRGANYVEVFEAAKSIIEKMTPIIPTLVAHRNDQLSVVERCYRMISEMSDEPISPKLRLSIGRFFMAGIRQYYFNFKKIDKLFLSALLKISEDAENRKILTQCLDNETVKKYHNREIEAKIFFYAMAVAEKVGDVAFEKELLTRILNRSWLMRNTVDVAYELGSFSIVKTLTDAAFENQYQKKNYDRFDEFRLQIATKENSSEGIAYFSAKRLLSGLKFPHFLDFRAQFSKDSKEVAALIKKVENLPDSLNKNELLAAIFSNENLGEKLFSLIEKANNLELLKKHAGALFKFNKKRGRDLVWKEIDEFLETHRGKPAAIQTRKFIRELYQFEADDLAKAVLRKIRAKHGQRISLMEELFIFR